MRKLMVSLVVVGAIVFMWRVVGTFDSAGQSVEADQVQVALRDIAKREDGPLDEAAVRRWLDHKDFQHLAAHEMEWVDDPEVLLKITVNRQYTLSLGRSGVVFVKRVP